MCQRLSCNGCSPDVARVVVPVELKCAPAFGRAPSSLLRPFHGQSSPTSGAKVAIFSSDERTRYPCTRTTGDYPFSLSLRYTDTLKFLPPYTLSSLYLFFDIQLGALTSDPSSLTLYFELRLWRALNALRSISCCVLSVPLLCLTLSIIAP